MSLPSVVAGSTSRAKSISGRRQQPALSRSFGRFIGTRGCTYPTTMLAVIEGNNPRYQRLPALAAWAKPLWAALDQVGAAEVGLRQLQVRTLQYARGWQFRGSPTFLLNGHDHFARPNAPWTLRVPRSGLDRLLGRGIGPDAA